MALKHSNRNTGLSFFPVVAILLLAGCLPASNGESQETTPSPQVIQTSTRTAAPIPSATPTFSYGALWNVLLEATPFAYTTPLPDSAETPIDGLYSKIDQSPPQWWRCYRCADYRPAGGMWRLKFDRGVMRIFYAVTGWRTVASYAVSGDHLTIFNDPFCLATG